MFIHPGRNGLSAGNHNNIMILKIDGTLDISSPKLTPICLPTSPITATEGTFAA